MNYFIAGLVVSEANFKADFFGLPQGFGGLDCDGNEDNITSCLVCSVIPFEEEFEEELPPPDPVIGDPEFMIDIGSVPGAACCQGDNRQQNDDQYDVAAISCLGK